MWNFLKRQLKTKTGKMGAALVLGTIVNSTVGDPDSASMVVQIANQVLTPETGTIGMAAMFLRDRDAKKDR